MSTPRRTHTGRHIAALERATFKRITARHMCALHAEPVRLAFGETGTACKVCGILIAKS